LATVPAGQPEPAKVKDWIKTSSGLGPLPLFAAGEARVRVEAARQRSVLKYILI
jgi:hypothetical protein